MNRNILVLVTGLLGTVVAHAQDPEFVQAGQWTILPASTSCSAYNHDVYEFNASPYNAMVLRHEAETDAVKLAVHFWPGAFTPSDEIILKLTTEDRKSISVVATAMAPYAVQTEALSAKQLDDLTNGEFVTASVAKVDGVVMVNMKDFGAALTALADCVKGI